MNKLETTMSVANERPREFIVSTVCSQSDGATKLDLLRSHSVKRICWNCKGIGYEEATGGQLSSVCRVCECKGWLVSVGPRTPPAD